MELKEFQEKFEQLQLAKEYSAYGLSRLASELFEKNIRPQMIVNYLGKGYIKGVKREGKWVIEEKEVRRWLKKYAIRNVVTI